MTARPPRLRRFVAASCLGAALLACAAPRALSAQAIGGCDDAARIRSVRIVGAPLPEATLLANLATQPPGFFARVFGVGERPCLDDAASRSDALRLAVLHRQRGWINATAQRRVERRGNGVRVTFSVTPGPRATLDSATVSGMPVPADGRTDAATPVYELVGGPLDRIAIERGVTRLLARLRDRGFARARELSREIVIDTVRGAGVLRLAVEPGPRLRIGALNVIRTGVNGDSATFTAPAIRERSRLETGALYRASDIERAQRNLYRTDAFRLVIVDTLPATVFDSSLRDSLVGIRIEVAESKTRTARVGVGWGTLECGRLQARVTDRGFLGLGRRVEFVGRASRFGVGEPADFAPGFCPQYIRDDPFSEQLNYYAGVTLSDASLFGVDLSPTLNLYSERRGEPYAFTRETDLGISLGISRALGSRTGITSTVSYERGRTLTTPTIGCVRFALCDVADFLLIAPGNTTRALDVGVVHDRTGGLVDPRDGARLRADVRVGRTSFALLEQADEAQSAWAFYRPALGATGFTRLFGGVLAARLDWTRVFAPTAPDIDGTPFLPPQERLYSGGQNSVRGYQQNLLGPIAYTVDRSGVDSVPVGDGYGLVVRPDATVLSASPEGGLGSVTGSLEWRRRFGWPTTALQWAAFVDAGAVWLETNALPRASDFRVTPGLGVRLDTPIGPFRIDIGYNPRQREAGKAFVIDSLGRDTDLAFFRVLCVSDPEPLDVQNEGLRPACPRTFTPRSGSSLLSRLVFHFSLGQAF